MEDFVVPPVERTVPDCYYFCVVWGARMRVRETKGPPEASFYQHGCEHEILCTKIISKGTNGMADVFVPDIIG